MRTHSHMARRSASLSRVRRVKCSGRGRRSCHNRPPGGEGSVATSHTVVSAPCAGSRRIGPVTLWKAGSESTTPGVSAQPGCIAWTPTRRHRCASTGSSATCTRLLRA